jgi:multiple sugar transport system permease protein
MFISPWLVHLLVFTLYPFVASLYLSLTSYDVFNPPRWVGTRNYTELLTDDPVFWTSLYNTVFYAFFSLTLGTISAITIAMLLNMQIGGLSFYRTVYYLPSITPVVAQTILWMWLFNPVYGPINLIIEAVGLTPPSWLSDPAWTKPTLILLGLWNIGGSIVIYLAGLQDVPRHLLEAAELDGANWWRKIRNVTLPMISPVIFFNFLTGLIGVLQYFTQAFVISGGTGGPADSTMFYTMYLFRSGFYSFKMGYASAMAWMLFVMILILTLLVWRGSERHIYYAGH